MKRYLVNAITLLIVFSAVAAASAQGRTPSIAWEVTDGVESPESAYYDEASGSLFVSQIGSGGPTGKDGDGYISRLAPDGEVVDVKWVTGLNAPKGLRSHGGRLWVSDIDRLIGIDIAEAKIVAEIDVAGAKFLNDVACDGDGAVYVSDMMGNKIYRHRDGRLDVFAEGETLEYPNGLLVVGDRLVVGSWGKPADDFSTEVPGRIFSLDLQTGEKSLITPEPMANFDGIEAVGSNFYIASDWNAGKIYVVRSDGRARPFLELAKGTADIGVIPGERLLIVPQMLENKITAYRTPGRAR